METVLRGVFPNDDRYWRIEWVDGIYKNPKVPSESLIGVSIAPLQSVAVDGNPTPIEAILVIAKERQIIRVGVGTIPSLIVGSIWRRRQMLPVIRYERRDFEVDLTVASVRILPARHQLATNRWMIPPYKYLVPREMMESPCVAIEIRTDVHALIIPCFEVLRAWYIRSTAMANLLFSGPLISVRNKIFDPAKSGLDASSDQWRVQLRTGLSASDVLPAALLACNEGAFRSASTLFNSIIKARPGSQAIRVVMLPPSCRGTLQARGIDVSSQGEKRFLVFDLVQIPYPLPAGGIVWDLDNSNANENGKDEKARESWRGRPSPRTPTRQDVLVHLDEPDNKDGSTREEYSAPLPSVRPQITRLKTVGEAATSSVPRPRDDDAAREHSTGVGTYARTSSKRLTIVASTDEPDSAPRRIAIGFEYISNLREILNLYPDTVCSAVAASKKVAHYEDGVRSHFPAVLSKEVHAWSFVGESSRQAVVLEIEHEGLFAYAIEIERRPSTVKEASEQYRLGFLGSDDGMNLRQSDLAKVLLTLAATRGLWPTQGGTIGRFRLYARKRRKSTHEFAFDLLNELRRWANREPLARSRFVAMPDMADLPAVGGQSSAA